MVGPQPLVTRFFKEFAGLLILSTRAKLLSFINCSGMGPKMEMHFLQKQLSFLVSSVNCSGMGLQ